MIYYIDYMIYNRNCLPKIEEEKIHVLHISKLFTLDSF